MPRGPWPCLSGPWGLDMKPDKLSQPKFNFKMGVYYHNRTSYHNRNSILKWGFISVGVYFLSKVKWGVFSVGVYFLDPFFYQMQLHEVKIKQVFNGCTEHTTLIVRTGPPSIRFLQHFNPYDVRCPIFHSWLHFVS